MINNSLSLLDCTLRDGGFINDWKFGKLSIRSIVSRLDNAGIDIIEIGFLDDSVKYDKDRSIFPNIQGVADTLGNALPKRSELTAMIDFGHFSKELLIPKKDSPIDGIRLIFKKNDAKKALEYAWEIKQKGYKLFLNPVSLTSYQDIEILELIALMNKLEPEAVSIVDTYGLMFGGDITRYIYLFNGNLNPEIALGYHSHNNLQMAFSNCIALMKTDLNRKIIIDSSILGMGKSAGNACTELVASYLRNNGKEIDIYQVLESAYTDIQRFQAKQSWGYSLEFLISAINECSVNWSKFLMKKYTLSVKDICLIMSNLSGEERLVAYSDKLAEQKYVEFMDRSVDDSERRHYLSDAVRNREILLLCPGDSLRTHRDKIVEYIKKTRPIVFAVNFISDYIASDYSFINNSIRYSQMMGIYPDLQEKPKIIITSNIVSSSAMPPEMVFNYKKLYEKIGGDNSAVLLLALLHSIGVRSLAVAGLDGYDEVDAQKDYFESEMQFFGTRGKELNARVITELQTIIVGEDPIKLNWLTPSLFEEKI
jgi:4-hydroxy 2-oxovalerate aldolase